MTARTQVDLFVGDVIEHASERAVLATLLNSLPAATTWAAVFANVNLGGRQVDFVVATEALTLVVEAKHFSRRVSGTRNGAWTMRAAGGAGKSVRNPYTQALAAKNVLRDTLQVRYGEALDYPNACVAVAPRLPTGSDVPSSDFKVDIVNCDELGVVLAKSSGLRLPKVRWIDFAAYLGLQRVHATEACWDRRLLEQEALVDAYKAELLRTYAPDIGLYQADTYWLGSQELDAAGVADRVVHGDDDLVILGPSGCGKSLLVKKVAIHCLERGYAPIVVQAKYFTGKLSEIVEREAVTLGAPSGTRLIKGAQATGSPVVLVLDGYNECPAADQLVLTRSLAAAVRRYGVQLVISAQVEIARPDLINGTHVRVAEPSKNLKAAIAGPTAARRLDYLLASVSSGLEANLVGRVGAALPDGASRFALFDAYARQKLGAEASDGIRLLASVAGMLMGRLTFSMSVREFERQAAAENVVGPAIGRILASGLVAKRSDRVSFVHELIFAAFAAEFVARTAKDDVEAVLHALRAPKYRNTRSLIVGAYDDERFISTLLAGIVDVDLLRAAATGECGSVARDWVTGRCREVLDRISEEAATVDFSLEAGHWNGAGVSEKSAREWTPEDLALMVPIANGLWRGLFLDPVLQAIGVMDQSLMRGFRTLKDQAKTKQIPLRSGLFADAYVTPGRAGISKLMRCIANDIAIFRAGQYEDVGKIRWEQPRTPGQTYLLLTLTRFGTHKEVAVPHILPLFGEQWSYQPYHLKLALLDFVHVISLSDGEVKHQLINALDTLLPNVDPMLSSIVIEALEHLGALEREVSDHVEVVKAELRDILSNTADTERARRAWGIYNCQFDHPYSPAYWEVIQELNPVDRMRLLKMACEGVEHASLFVAPMIRELVADNDPSVAPALERWLALPALDSFMPQEAVAVFIRAHIGFGTLGLPLPKIGEGPATPSEIAVSALGKLYYWMHRPGISAELVNTACASVGADLLGAGQSGAASALFLLTHSFQGDDGVPQLIWHRYPGLVAEICRAALRRPEDQIGYFPHDSNNRADALQLAARLIGELGDGGDAQLLRGLCERDDIGQSAIAALQRIEIRMRGASG